MEEKLNEWKKEESENEIEIEEESAEPPRKMSPTEILKKKMRKEHGIRITIRNSSIFPTLQETLQLNLRKNV